MARRFSATSPICSRLLAAADVVQPFLHVDGLVAPALQRQPRLGLRQLLVNGGQHILGIAGLKMGDRGVEILLRNGRERRALFGTQHAALRRTDILCLTCQAPGLPEGRGGQRQRHQSDQDRGDLLGRRQGLEGLRGLGHVEMKSDTCEHDGCGQQQQPRQETPHRKSPKSNFEPGLFRRPVTQNETGPNTAGRGIKANGDIHIGPKRARQCFQG
jgi:hypothetical protein